MPSEGSHRTSLGAHGAYALSTPQSECQFTLFLMLTYREGRNGATYITMHRMPQPNLWRAKPLQHMDRSAACPLADDRAQCSYTKASSGQSCSIPLLSAHQERDVQRSPAQLPISPTGSPPVQAKSIVQLRVAADIKEYPSIVAGHQSSGGKGRAQQTGTQTVSPSVCRSDLEAVWSTGPASWRLSMTGNSMLAGLVSKGRFQGQLRLQSRVDRAAQQSNKHTSMPSLTL